MERSRDAPRDGGVRVGVSTSVERNGKRGCARSFPLPVVGFVLDGTLVDTLDDLAAALNHALALAGRAPLAEAAVRPMIGRGARHMLEEGLRASGGVPDGAVERLYPELLRLEEHTSELQSLMSISYAAFRLKKKTTNTYNIS